jgi:Zn-dependent peptidase ImmA (M78 family)/transcriptional regulator with XRE-family HTH domain
MLRDILGCGYHRSESSVIGRGPTALEKAFINGEVLRWARKRGSYSEESFAIQAGITRQKLTSWEAGTDFPPFGGAQELAKILRIPFGYLFLSNPPDDSTPLPDLRTINGDSKPPSPDFADLLNEVLIKHDWYREHAKKRGARPLSFIGRYSVSGDVREVVADIRRSVVPAGLHSSASNPGDYLRLLAEHAEQQNILVMRCGVVRGNPKRGLSVKEFRGFAISDKIAPLIFINAKDALVAQVFTFAHELVHLWIGQSGISNLDPSAHNSGSNRSDVEQFCNSAAAELLVPPEEFRRSWDQSNETLEARTNSIARRFRVSVPVAIRRALELSMINRSQYFALFRAHQERVQAIEEAREQNGAQESSGGNFYNTFFARNGYRFSRALTSAVRSGELSTLEAARLLSVRTGTIAKLAERTSS